MSKNSENLVNCRLQDIVARVAGVSLNNVAKTLRALTLIGQYYPGEDDLDWGRLIDLLIYSARNGREFSTPLHAKPNYSDIESCERAYNILLNELLEHNKDFMLDDIKTQRGDPFERLNRSEQLFTEVSNVEDKLNNL